jgi:hypothetical protein
VNLETETILDGREVRIHGTISGDIVTLRKVIDTEALIPVDILPKLTDEQIDTLKLALYDSTDDWENHSGAGGADNKGKEELD